MIDTILEILAHIGTLFELPGQARQWLHGPIPDWERPLQPNDLLGKICDLLYPGDKP